MAKQSVSKRPGVTHRHRRAALSALRDLALLLLLLDIARPAAAAPPPPPRPRPGSAAPAANRGQKRARPLIIERVRPRDAVPLSSPLAAPIAITPRGDALFLTEDGFLGAAGSRGQLLWSLLVASSRGAPALDEDGGCYVAGLDQQLYATTGNGRLRWVRPLDGRPTRGVAVGPSVVAVTLDSGLVAWWQRKSGMATVRVALHATPSAGAVMMRDESVLVPTLEGLLLRVTQAGVTWRTAITERPLGAVAVGEDGRAYLGAADGTLASVDADGKLRWKIDTGAPIVRSPALGTEGQLYVAAGDRVWACAAATGAIQWKTDVGGPIIGGPLVTAQRTIRVSVAAVENRRRKQDARGWIASLDDTGRRRASQPLPAPPTPGLNLAEHQLWVGLRDNTLRRYRVPEPGLAASAWPKARGGLRNQGASRSLNLPPTP